MRLWWIAMHTTISVCAGCGRVLAIRSLSTVGSGIRCAIGSLGPIPSTISRLFCSNVSSSWGRILIWLRGGRILDVLLDHGWWPRFSTFFFGVI